MTIEGGRQKAEGGSRQTIRGLLAGLLLCFLTGCSDQYVNEQYGSRSGVGADSINGTTILGELFAKAGHRVRSVGRLYPKVGEADVIVWFPTDFQTPSQEAIGWFDDWLLYGEEGKTLIYVSPDYRAGEHYWSLTKVRAPAAQQGEYNKKLRESKQDFTSWRSSAPAGEAVSSWFTPDRRNQTQTVTQLRGPWAENVDAGEIAIEHRRYLTPDNQAEPLLTAGDGHPLVSQIVCAPEEWDWRNGDSRLVMIENGSFLLNASLVNKEHRKLAGRLVDHVGPPKLDVVFLQSRSDPLVLESDPSDSPPTGLRLFAIWPIGAVLAQLAALGLIYATARWPIFGTPRRSEQPSLTDFGRHVTALGRLLAGTRDRAYAYAQLRTYFQIDDKK
ncbi:MAG: hypothetical protein AAGF31_03670 [Planctomycetota bacterium]